MTPITQLTLIRPAVPLEDDPSDPPQPTGKKEMPISHHIGREEGR